MNSIIISGDFGDIPKESSVMKKLASLLNSNLINGGTLDTLEKIRYIENNKDLIIWSVNIDNGEEKLYPKKPIGSILLCTKVIRDNRNFGDAVSRIFKMNANAVIAIDSSTKPFKFNLIDALGNNWITTSDLNELSNVILKFYDWSKSSIRLKSNKVYISDVDKDVDELCDIVKIIATKVENERGGRYFGNVSTRCSKMFPSMKFNEDVVLVSSRNTPKEFLSSSDFVSTILKDGDVYYVGNKKPSVDTPIQLNLYEKLKNINFIIHGHAYIKDANFTEHYYPCGDLRELTEILNKINVESSNFILNLKNHGFIIAANNLEELRKCANNLSFIYREIGTEKVNI